MPTNKNDQSRVDSLSPFETERATAAEADSASVVVDGPWGYACVEGDAVFIPVIMATHDWPMRRTLAHLHEQTRLTRFVFASVLNAEAFKRHLRHVVREWDEWVPELEDYSHCIEIAYQAEAS